VRDRVAEAEAKGSGLGLGSGPGGTDLELCVLGSGFLDGKWRRRRHAAPHLMQGKLH